jgi:hypothetical protein
MTERMREPLAHRRGLRQDEHDDPDDVKLPELNLIRYGGDGDRSVVVCGWFAYEREVPNPPGGGAPGYFVRRWGGGRAAPGWSRRSSMSAADWVSCIRNPRATGRWRHWPTRQRR